MTQSPHSLENEHHIPACEDAPEKHLHRRKKTLTKSFISLRKLHNQTSNAWLKVLWLRTCIFRQFVGAFLSKFCLNIEHIYTFYYICCAALRWNRAAQPKLHSHKRFNGQQYISKRKRNCIAVALLSWMNKVWSKKKKRGKRSSVLALTTQTYLVKSKNQNLKWKFKSTLPLKFSLLRLASTILLLSAKICIYGNSNISSFLYRR